MDVTSHMSHHEAAEELPLVTDDATVTAVEAMDEERTDEVRDALAMFADVYEVEECVGDADEPIDWGKLEAAVPDGGDAARRLETLRDRYERTHPALVRICLQPGEDVEFVPGQYISLRYDGTTRPYSIASSPNRDDLELCIRRVPGGRLSERLCMELAPGDTTAVRGPNGEFVIETASTNDIAFLATGTGIAPLKSMLDYLFEEGADEYDGGRRDVWVFLGAGWCDDLPYDNAFRAYAEERANVHYVPTCSRESYLSDWDGETAYIQYALCKYLEEGVTRHHDLPEMLAEYVEADPAYDIDARIDPAALDVYACGVNAMVYSLLDTVRAIGVPEECVDCEGYG